MSNEIFAALIGATSVGVVLYFRVRAVKKALNLANEKLKIDYNKLLDDKNRHIDSLTIEIEKLKDKWKRTKIDADRLENQKAELIFSSITNSNAQKDSIIALKKFNEFIMDLDNGLAPSNFYLDETEYINDTIETMDLKLKDARIFIAEFLKQFSHIYKSNEIIMELKMLDEKCKNIDQNQDESKNFKDWEHRMIEIGPELGEVWDKLHQLYTKLQKENDEFIMLKKDYINNLKKGE